MRLYRCATYVKRILSLAIVVVFFAVTLPLGPAEVGATPIPQNSVSVAPKESGPEQGRFEKYKFYIAGGLAFLLMGSLGGLVYKRKRGSKHRELLIFLGW